MAPGTSDHVLTATVREGRVVVYAVDVLGIAAEIQRRHGTWPVVTAALGRLCAIGAAMSTTLKDESFQITLQVMGNGPAGRLIVTASGDGSIRGFADEPIVDLPPTAQGKLDVRGAVGTEGSLVVVKDLGLKEPYRGIVPLVSGEIGEDFTYYFAVSEQTASAVSVGVLVDTDGSVLSAGGLLIQMLPGAIEADVAAAERALANLAPVSALLQAGASPEDLIRLAFPDGVHILGRTPLRFQCTCSKERLGQILLSLGSDELEDIRAEQGGAELVCHFCGNRYWFDGDELGSMSDEARRQAPEQWDGGESI